MSGFADTQQKFTGPEVGAMTTIIPFSREPLSLAATMREAFLIPALMDTPYRRAQLLAEWYADAKLEAKFLEGLASNWDSYGARPVTKSAITGAIRFLEVAAGWRLPKPAIVPASNGEIQLEWHQRGVDAEIYVMSDGRIAASVDVDGVENEFDMLDERDYSKLKQKLSRLLIGTCHQMHA